MNKPRLLAHPQPLNIRRSINDRHTFLFFRERSPKKNMRGKTNQTKHEHLFFFSLFESSSLISRSRRGACSRAPLQPDTRHLESGHVPGDGERQNETNLDIHGINNKQFTVCIVYTTSNVLRAPAE